MKVQDSRQQQKTVNRSVYGVLVTVIVVFVLILVVLQLQRNESGKLEQLANKHHLATSEKNLKIIGLINDTRLWFRDFYFESEHQNSAGNLESMSIVPPSYLKSSRRGRIADFKYEAVKVLSDIELTQAEFPDPEFDAIGLLLVKSYKKVESDFNNLVSDDSFTYKNVESIVAPLNTVAHQLYLLHKHAYQETLLIIENNKTRDLSQLIALIVVLAVIGAFGVIRMLRHVRITLTDLTKTQVELQKSEHLLREAQHVAHLGYFEWDVVTDNVVCSEEAYNIYGLPPGAELTLESIYSLSHKDDAGRVSESLKDAVQNATELNIEYRLVRPDGKDVFVHAKGELTANEQGKVIRMLGTVIDITEHKKTEHKLELYRDHLKDLVDERTAELRDAQDELVRKERLATLGQLTATVSHELRNPLGAMRPSLYVIEKKSDKDDERVQKAIERIDRNIDRCDRIIDEMLDFTRIIELNLKSVRIDGWLDSVISEQDIPQGIHVDKNLSLENFKMAIDVDRLRRAVINVVDNACHAMMDDNQRVVKNNIARLNIKTEINDKRLEIIVTDTGAGIPKEILAKIFEPLFSTKGFGVGLGMPTVKQIMGQHRGGIDIDSEEGKGTAVTLWLPISDADEVEGEAVA